MAGSPSSFTQRASSPAAAGSGGRWAVPTSRPGCWRITSAIPSLIARQISMPMKFKPGLLSTAVVTPAWSIAARCDFGSARSGFSVMLISLVTSRVLPPACSTSRSKTFRGMK